MPSVQVAQLRQECAQLGEHFQDPEAFPHHLDLLLERYAQRAKRKGRVRSTGPVMRSYDVPAPVLRQLRLELSPKLMEEPARGLALVDALWSQRILEHRLLAIRLIGLLPENFFGKVRKRLLEWAQENREEQLLGEIAERGTQSLREQDPEGLLKLCASLLKKKDLRPRATALLALKALLDHNPVSNLPALLDVLSPSAQNAPKNLRPYLLEVYASLAAFSPGEALYFLQQRLAENPGEGTRWMARRALKFFPPEGRKALQEALEV